MCARMLYSFRTFSPTYKNNNSYDLNSIVAFFYCWIQMEKREIIRISWENQIKNTHVCSKLCGNSKKCNIGSVKYPFYSKKNSLFNTILANKATTIKFRKKVSSSRKHKTCTNFMILFVLVNSKQFKHEKETQPTTILNNGRKPNDHMAIANKYQ